MKLIDAIKENQKSLKVFLEKEMFLQASVPLRVLLCDNEMPILLEYSKKRKRPLIVWAITSLEELSLSLLTGLQSDLSIPCQWDPRNVPNRNKIPLDKFLKRNFCAAKDGNRYTPLQIIKATSNKLGFTHYDQKRQKFLNDSLDWKLISNNMDDQTRALSLVDSHLFYLASWTSEAIDYLLSDEVNFTLFCALDKIDNAIGEMTIFCVQTGGILKLEFNKNEIVLKTKQKDIQLEKVNESFIFVQGKKGKMTISSNLIDKNETIKYSNIVTENSIRAEQKVKKMTGHIFFYSRLLNNEEINQLKKNAIRKKVFKDLKKKDTLHPSWNKWKDKLIGLFQKFKSVLTMNKTNR